MLQKMIFLIPFLVPVMLKAQEKMIYLNQSGFYTHAPKLAVGGGKVEVGNLCVMRAYCSATVFRGPLSDTISPQYSSSVTRLADFSAFNKTGRYVLYEKGAGNSYPFIINNKVQHAVAVSSLKGFYYQRVSMPLEPKYAGKWARPAGHPDTEVLIHPSAVSEKRPADTKIASPGGWYDAGDYNKYIVNSGITMGTLFSAYQDFRSYFDSLRVNIPESRNRVPDILDETIYNLRWMLTMQDPHDGGVYHKCTNAAFDGMVMPGITKLPRYVVQKSTAAALDFAAVMAQASRIFHAYNRQLPGLSDSCFRAALGAFSWAEKNPAVIYDQDAINKSFQPPITTGAYGDRDLRDEWFWAAAELFVRTKEDKYLQVLRRYHEDSLKVPSWTNERMLGVYSLLREEKNLPAGYNQLFKDLKQQLIRLADEYIRPVEQNAFRTVMGRTRRDFVWGSSAVAANQGILLLNAFLHSGDKSYVDYALANLDYIMGR